MLEDIKEAVLGLVRLFEVFIIGLYQQRFFEKFFYNRWDKSI